MFLVGVLARDHDMPARGVVGHLEALDQLVPPVLVDGRLVGDQDPVGALTGLDIVEDLVVHVRRVVDDQDRPPSAG